MAWAPGPAPFRRPGQPTGSRRGRVVVPAVAQVIGVVVGLVVFGPLERVRGGGREGGRLRVEGEGGLVGLDAGEEAVHERRGVVRGQVLGQDDRLADRYAVRHVVGPEQLVDADPQDVPVDGGHPLHGPVDEVPGDQLVDALAVRRDSPDQLGRVRLHRHLAERLALGQQLERGQAAQLRLEEDVKGALARLATRGHVALSGWFGGVVPPGRRLGGASPAEATA